MSNVVNLNDALSAQQSNQRRAYYLPLAVIPPAHLPGLQWPATAAVTPDQYDGFREDRPLADKSAQTSNASVDLSIYVKSPAMAPTENGLPPPAIRLHAVDGGILTFMPGRGATPHQLTLRMMSFVRRDMPIPWFQRWVDANCLPSRLVYANVDLATLEALLTKLPLPGLPRDHYFGLSFPSTVTAANRSNFIARFLKGERLDEEISANVAALVVQSGAYIGQIAAAAPGTNNERYRLTLRATYEGHTANDPRPMNPRELFNLLFGNDSVEAETHPLLLGMAKYAEKETVEPESRRMLLRPPLRTWHRVQWEADLEIKEHKLDWKVPVRDSKTQKFEEAGKLGPNRFYNNRDVKFNNGDYWISLDKSSGLNKCNLFVSDICLRSGFRVPVHQIDTGLFHYLSANAFANAAHAANESDTKQERIPLYESVEKMPRQWGWGLQNWLHSTSRTMKDKVPDLQGDLNRAMQNEGRCFILAGARAPKGTRKYGIGHIVIVASVVGQPVRADKDKPDKNNPGHTKQGLESIPIVTKEARSDGAQTSMKAIFQLVGIGGPPDARDDFLRLQLIELQPGMDPDTIQGLRDLNVLQTQCNDEITRCRPRKNKKEDRLPTIKKRTSKTSRSSNLKGRRHHA